jgi:hypothetical protein
LAEADSHDLIRVHGARENNLKDISVEIPKRRLTVFTASRDPASRRWCSARSPRESQRLINEAGSAFVQAFMPTLARPDVDVLDGLTPAIIVDQSGDGRQRALDRRHGNPTPTRCSGCCGAGWASPHRPRHRLRSTCQRGRRAAR